MNLSDETRKQIEKNKGLKLAVGEINNHLSTLEGLVRKDIMEQVDEAYQKGLEDGKKAFDLLESERNSEYQRGLSEGNDIGYKDGVKDGQNEAWEVAKKLFSTMAESDIEKAFPIEWNSGGFKALMNLQPQEAIERLKSYEDDRIEVGDEVEWDNDFTGDRFIVTRIYQPYGKKEQCDGIDDDGDVYRAVLIESLVKTGRHFDIQSILEAMKA